MRVDLDGTPRSRRPRVHVEAQRRSQPRRAWTVGELRFGGVGGVRAGFEPAKVTVERRLGGPLAGLVGYYQRCVEGDQAIAFYIGR